MIMFMDEEKTRFNYEPHIFGVSFVCLSFVKYLNNRVDSIGLGSSERGKSNLSFKSLIF
jgi:hypothetical protein